MNPHSIEGTVALVTGANRGIGRALTEALLARGATKVYAAARTPEGLRALADERLVPLRLDVTDPDQIRALTEAVSDVKLVFNNAGVQLGTGIAHSAVLNQARREMEVNYFGPLQLIHRLAPRLARNGGGAVVNIGSAAGLTSVPFFPTYSASKGALHSLTQAARILLAPQGSSVFGVYAGPVDTDMTRELPLAKTSPRDGRSRFSPASRRLRRTSSRTRRRGFRSAVRGVAKGLGMADGRHDRRDALDEFRGLSEW